LALPAINPSRVKATQDSNGNGSCEFIDAAYHATVCPRAWNARTRTRP
jgi:hypothetical protein